MNDPSILEIQQAVSAAFGMPLIDMRSHRALKRLAQPRQAAMYLAAKLTPHSLATIGRHFGDRDPTTVGHALKRVEELARYDADFGERISALRQHLSGEVENGTGDITP